LRHYLTTPFLTPLDSSEMGYFRIVMGKNALGIETQVAWATPGYFSVHNFACNEDASNCGGNEAGSGGMSAHLYVDPSVNSELLLAQRKV